MPQMVDGTVQYSGTKEVMADYAKLARDCGARIIGGCCGTTPDILAFVIEAMKNYVPGEVPRREKIEDILGPIKVPPAGG